MHAKVTPSPAISSKIFAPSIARSTTCVPPMPVSAYTPPQPLQWNIGSVHSSTSSCATRRCAISQYALM